jgi:hypothetical protein
LSVPGIGQPKVVVIGGVVWFLLDGFLEKIDGRAVDAFVVVSPA